LQIGFPCFFRGYVAGIEAPTGESASVDDAGRKDSWLNLNKKV
jgi:hypothetical protein